MRVALPRGLPSLPTGIQLPRARWDRRHRGVQVLLAVHAVALPLFGLAMGEEVGHAMGEGLLLLLVLVASAWARLPTRVRSVVASFGLMSSSAILMHFSGGTIEAHFHFFVMLGVIFLYEDWVPYVLSVGYVAVHHAVLGTLDPASVYNHPAALAAPVLWAGIHAVSILGLSAALLVAWGVIEGSRRAEEHALAEARGLRRQLAAQEKLSALGTLVAGIAHEVRTPLTIVRTNAALLERRLAKGGPVWSDDLREHVAEIQGGVDRIDRLVAQLKRFHRPSDAPLQEVRLDAMVRDAVDLFQAANRTGPTIRTQLARTPASRLDPYGVQQVVLNLLSNAVDAVDAREGHVLVTTLEAAGAPILIVEDNGAGMPREVVERLFEPLFTTKKQGMGLGMSIVKRIVDDHGGRIDVVSQPGAGTTFRVRFGQAGPTSTPDPPAKGGSPVGRPLAAPGGM